MRPVWLRRRTSAGHAKRRLLARIEEATRAGDHLRAIELCQTATGRFADGDPEFELALVFRSIGEPDLAARALESALARGPQLVLEVEMDPRLSELRTEASLVKAMSDAHARLRATS